MVVVTIYAHSSFMKMLLRFTDLLLLRIESWVCNITTITTWSYCFLKSNKTTQKSNFIFQTAELFLIDLVTAVAEQPRKSVICNYVEGVFHLASPLQFQDLVIGYLNAVQYREIIYLPLQKTNQNGRSLYVNVCLCCH